MASQSPGPGSHRGSSMSGGVGAQSPAAYHRASTGPMPPEQPPQKNNEDATTRKWQDAYMHLKDEKERVSEDLASKEREVESLTAELSHLREELEKERQETRGSTASLKARSEELAKE